VPEGQAMRGVLIAACLATTAFGTPASAFWQRSQVSACSDATTDAERQHLRCWELNAYGVMVGIGRDGLPPVTWHHGRKPGLISK